MRNKNQIAQSLYGFDFEDLSAGEKATVTRAYNNQTASAGGAVVSATIGRLGNGANKCHLSEGATIADLLRQAKFSLDAKKESVIALSTGSSVSMTTPVVNGEEYSIVPEVKSA